MQLSWRRDSPIFPYIHFMDNSTPTVIIPSAHAAAIFTTSDQGLTESIHNNHRTQTCQGINVLFEKLWLHLQAVHLHISPKDNANPELYYSDKDIKDLT